MHDSSGFRSRKAGILPVLAAALSLSACTSNVYMGIPLTDGSGDLALRSLAQSAAAGDKQAQLDLGIRYEEGNGVERDLRIAKKLYQLAATDSGGTLWVYSPPVGNGTSGRVIPMRSSHKNFGLIEAKSRLTNLCKNKCNFLNISGNTYE